MSHETAKIIRGVDGDRFALHTPYDDDFRQELKDLVPKRDREWDPGDTRWLVAEEWEEKVAQLCIVHFHSVEIFGDEGELDEIRDRHGRAIQDRLL